MSWGIGFPFKPSSISISTTTEYSDDLAVLNIGEESYDGIEREDESYDVIDKL